MRLESGYISLRGLHFYALHGVLSQENKVGNHYLVDLRVGYPLQQAMETDLVGDTLNYASLYTLVEKEMKSSSNLLEHVAGRIVKAISTEFPEVTSVDIRLTKQNPPIGADCDGAEVEVHFVKD